MDFDRERFDRDLKRYLALHPSDGEQEMRARIDEFIRGYNADSLHFDLTPAEARREDALGKLAEARNERADDGRALSLAREAVAIDPDCVEARHFINCRTLKGAAFTQAAAALVKTEQERLMEAGLFTAEDVGHFWQIAETRPYMRIRYDLIQALTEDRRYAEAARNAEGALILNENDNLGIRYQLAALYARRDDLAGLAKLYERYPEQSPFMLYPLAVAHYRAGNLDEAKRHLIAIRKANRHLAALLCGLTALDPKIWNSVEAAGSYSPGTVEEAYFVLLDDSHLVAQNPRFRDFAITLADLVCPAPRKKAPPRRKSAPVA